VYLARDALAHAIERVEDDEIDRPRTILTSYRTRALGFSVVTTREAQLEPGISITWKHVAGPLSGSVEAISLTVLKGGATIALYDGTVVARDRVLRFPPAAYFVGLLAKNASLGLLKGAQDAFEGKIPPEGDGILMDGGVGDIDGDGGM